MPSSALSRPGDGRRLMVISHPAVVSVNQEVYLELQRRGWQIAIVVPDRWRHEYAATDVAPQALDGLQGALRPTRMALPGRAQRHFYLARCGAICARERPDVAFVEAESFSFSAAQWSRVLTRANVPFGVQCAENIDRALPLPVRWMRGRVLRRSAFVAARSDTAVRLARAWGATGDVAFAPHAVPGWETEQAGPPSASGQPNPRPFTVGYAGRLVPSKGLADLLAAVRQLDAPVELVLIGDGELRAQLEGQSIPGSKVRVVDGLSHEQMAAGYAQMDVLALPSRTTPTWKEQFGRVIVEALWCGVPVVGSDSGEIPWLIELTGGGLTFPEGQPQLLAKQLRALREDPELGARLANTGRAAVERLFTVPAATDPLERMLTDAVRSRQPAAHTARGGAPPSPAS
ncbi:MAG TPA: glycosyltransferase family 4 protein [Solirubrobacteraceae bacterium]|nr:glycosyltransferase family 4 protein [Solirubrobacteraceae bacterium]